MAQTEIIREFLASLGYKVDASGERAFLSSLGKTTAEVFKLGAAIEATAVGVVAAVARMASAMEDLYFASRRTGASVEGIQAFGYAASQLGSSVEGARNSLEGFGRAIRGAPGMLAILQRLGVETRDANGGLRDTSAVLGDLGRKLATMPFPIAKAYAGLFGIDERTLFALMDGIGEFSAEYQNMLKLAGMNSKQAASDAHGFMVQLRSLGAAFDILQQKASAELFKAIGDDLHRLRDYLLVNSGPIVDVITRIARGMIVAAQVFTRLVLTAGHAIAEIIHRFQALTPHAQHLIEEFFAIITAWKLLNSAFLRSPIGIIFALGTALLLLYDDYETWKAGGKSLIDWSKWQPDIDRAIKALEAIGKWLNTLAQDVGGWQNVLEIFAGFLATRWVISVIASFGRAAAAARAFTLATLGSKLGVAALLAFLGYETFHVSGAGETQADRDKEGITPNGTPLTEQTPHNNTAGNFVRRLFGITPKDSSGNAQRIYNEAIKQGASPAQAAALVAHAQRESGFDPTDVSGDSGTAHGLWQWHADRRADFRRMFGHEVEQGTVEEQTQFKLWELRNPSAAGYSPLAAREFANATTTAEASQAIADDLRPADRAGAATRGAHDADTWLNRFTHPGTPDSTPHLLGGGGTRINVPNIADPGLMHGYDIGASAPVNVNQTNSIVIHGATDPSKTADQVSQARQTVDNSLIRNFRANVA